MTIAKDAYSKAKSYHQNQTKKKRGEVEDPNPAIVAEVKTAYKAASKTLEKAKHAVEVAGANVFPS